MFSGYDGHTKDTAFTVGLQGIEMDKAETIENVMLDTFEDIAKTGFESQRVQAILNRTELSLKKQKNEFGWSLIMSLTSGWNHVEDPLTLLSINPILEKFKSDIHDENFLKNKVQEHFLNNQHRLTLTMSPKKDFLEQQQKQLNDLETNLVTKLSPNERQKAIEQGQKLSEMQSAKDSEETMACLPTLTLSDIPLTLPNFGGISDIDLNGIKGQISTQPTNEVAYIKFRLNTEKSLTNEQQELLPLFSMFMTDLGAGSKSYRDLDLLMDLHTGGMGSSLHLSENPQDASNLIQNGLLLSSHCLERNVEPMLSLWKDIFHDLLVPNDGQMETSSQGLLTRLNDLISTSAVESKNGLAYGGHHYAMVHAASKLTDLPALISREKQSGISMVRLLNKLASGDKSKVQDLLEEMTKMARNLLTVSNIETYSVSATSQKSPEIVEKIRQLMTELPDSSGKQYGGIKIDGNNGEIQEKNTYIVAPFPVHFCSAVLKGAPSYTHTDAAPLRVLSRLLSSKFLHVEIREKGGAYGGGCSANPTSGTISFYSYRDPNFQRTMETFQNSNQWIQNADSFTQRDVDEAKLNVFKSLDKPVLPGARGQRLFLSGITDEQFEIHRQQLRQVTIADVQRVSQEYLGQSLEKSYNTTLGPEPKESFGFKVEQLLLS